MRGFRKKRNIIIMLGVIIAGILWAVEFWHINVQYPVQEALIYTQGEKVCIENLYISVTSHQWMQEKELMNYNIEEIASLGKRKVLLLNLHMENSTVQTRQMHLYTYLLEYDYYSNAINLELFMELNPRESLTVTLEPGEQKNLKVPFLLYEKQFTERQWSQIEEKTGGLIVSLNPQKICLGLSKN